MTAATWGGGKSLGNVVVVFGALGALLVAPPARAQDAKQFPTDFTDNLHQQVLTLHVNQLVGGQVVAEVLGTVDVALGSVGIASMSGPWRDEPRFAATWTIGFGIVDGAAAASLFMSRDTRSRVLEIGTTVPSRPRPASWAPRA